MDFLSCYQDPTPSSHGRPPVREMDPSKHIILWYIVSLLPKERKIRDRVTMESGLETGLAGPGHKNTKLILQILLQCLLRWWSNTHSVGMPLVRVSTPCSCHTWFHLPLTKFRHDKLSNLLLWFMMENKLTADELNQFNLLCFLDKLKFWFKRKKKKLWSFSKPRSNVQGHQGDKLGLL